MKPLIVVTRKIPDVGLDMLQKKYVVKISPHDRILKRNELKRIVRGADAILSILTDKIDGEIMDAAGKNLKIVANYAVGFDNIDLKAAAERKIYVTNTPGVLTESVAEHTFALILAVAKRIAEADRFVRGGNYRGWEPELLLGQQLWGKTIGIVGLGRIGSFVTQIAYGGFKMKVLYHDIKRNEEYEMMFSAEYRELSALLKESDIVTLHVPLLPSTHHLIGAKELRTMKKSAILVNTSRGPVVDEKALVTALGKKQIAGAGLDVYEFEPKFAPGLTKLANIILTPHTASATREARDAMSRLAAENIIAALSGKVPPNLVK